MALKDDWKSLIFCEWWNLAIQSVTRGSLSKQIWLYVYVIM